MENERDGVTDERAILQSYLVWQTLESWRFILLFSAPPLVWTLLAVPPAPLRVFILLLCGLIWFGCWRLWLDAHYLRLITQQNNHHAGEALFFIWRRPKLIAASFAARQRGAIKQCHVTLGITGLLWLIWLAALLNY